MERFLLPAFRMLSNYLKIALRNLRRNFHYVLINVLGLGVALGFCILAFLNYRFSNSFDHWHRQGGQTFRVEMLKASTGEPNGMCPPALAAAAPAQIAAVERSTTWDQVSTVVKRDEQVFNETLFFTDENFLQIFDFEVLMGDPDLSDPNAVLITEETAQKYFGSTDPIGQNLLFFADTERQRRLSVAAVLRNPPLNSSLRFKFVTHRDNQLDGDARADYNSWKWATDAVFLQLKNPSGRAEVEQALGQFAALRNTARPDWTVQGFRLSPLRQMASNSRDLRGNMLWPGPPPAAVWGNVTMALLLLLTAALNFANMTIAACNRRLREMGVRKVMGGTRLQLMRQLLTESLVIVLLATGLGMVLAFPIADWFNGMWNFTDLRVDYTDPQLLGYIAVTALATTLLAGSYPALYISAFRPASIFRGGLLFGGNNLFSRLMMGMQVAISIVSVVTGLSFARNAERNRNADIGFAYDGVLQAWLQDEKSYRMFADGIRDIPGVQAMAGTQHLPGFGYTIAEFDYQGQNEEANLYNVGNDFLKIMDFRLLQGSFPTLAGDTSISPEVLVNQKFVNEIAGGKNPIGQEIRYKGEQYRVAGVMADFITNTPFAPLRPSLIRFVPPRLFTRCVVRTGSDAEAKPVLAAMEQVWKKIFPFTPFNVGYQREMLREAIEVSDNVASSMGVFSMVTVLLGMAGLFSLISLDVLRRLREMAIRRVMGASAYQVAWMLHRHLIWVFLLAVALGCAGGWFLAKSLMDSIFKINFGVPPTALLLGALGVMLVAGATIAFKLVQMLRVSPAEVLRGD
jgi:hypothetical protein